MRKNLLWMLTAILICGLVVSSCSNDDEPTKPSTDEVEEQLQQMTLREKVGQMFYIRPESLDPSIEWTTYDDLAAIKLQEVTKEMKEWNEQYPVGAITQHYSRGDAAVKSIQAGVDIVLGPRDFIEAFDAVMTAVNEGTISEERINQSVRRILTLRKELKR